MTVTTEPASKATGQAIDSNVSLVLREIADTAAGIGEALLAAVSRHVAADNTTPAIREGGPLLVASGSGTASGVVKAA